MEKKIQYSFGLLSMMLFIAITVVSGELTSETEALKLFLIGKPLILACSSSSGDNANIIWKKNDVKVQEIKEIKDRVKIHEKEGKFVIEKAHEDDKGNYSCSLPDGSVKSFDVWAQVVVKIPSNLYVVENEKLEIVCIARGTNAEISWQFSNSSDSDNPVKVDINADDHIKLEEHDNIEGSRLVIDKIELSDRGTYFCIGTNDFMKGKNIPDAVSDGIVRVKDKLAALWPFLGICAEVFILCAIILIYEKRRNKTDLDESDTDQSPEKNDHNLKDSDVRHRK